MPSADTLLLAGLLVLQQILHHREKNSLLDRLGKPAPPPPPPAHKIPQRTMADTLRTLGKDDIL